MKIQSKKSRKYESVEEVKQHRDEISETYGGELPDYLHDYFDEKILKLKKEEFFAEKRRLKYETPLEEKKEYYAEKEKEFWKNNDFQIIKKKRRVGCHLEPCFEEPPRNEQRVEDEKDLTEEEIKILIHMCETDLYLFAIRYFSHYLRKSSSSFHKYLYNYLTNNTNNRHKYSRGFRHAVAAPRGNAKTSIISGIFPLWCLAYNKKKFMILVSDTVGQAIDFLSDIKRELDNNALLLRDFPHLSGKGSVWRSDEIITKNNVKVLALGTGSKIRGRKFGTHRPDLIILDDVENADMLRSEKEREHIRYEWFDKEVMFVGAEEGTYIDFLFVGTILGKTSLLYAVLDPKEYPDWTSKRFKAVLSFSDSGLWDEWADLYRDRFDEDRITTARQFFENNKNEMLDGTEVLWPEGDPYYDLMVVKLTSRSAFESEKQNNPRDPSKILILFEELHLENFETPPWIDMIRNKRNPIYGAIDPSLGKHQKKGDPSCICVAIRDIKTGFILVYSFSLKRRIVDQQIEDILKTHKRSQLSLGRGFKLFSVETNAFQLVMADNLRKLSRKTGIYAPIKDVIVKNDKKARFEKHIPLMRDGTIIFDKAKYEDTAQYNRSIDQISTFVGDGSDDEDDAVDAFSLVMDSVTAPKFKLRTKQAK